MNLRRGLARLGIALAAVWFVFWTCAYVLHPPSSLRPEPGFAARISGADVVLPCLAVAALLGVWVAAGFRPD